jgi:D-amino-acid oxidase
VPEILVVGAGVIGLTCAIRLREAGLRAEVVAREPPERTTSAVAAALWYPYRAFPRERVAGWSARGFEVLSELAGVRGAGVRMRSGTELAGDAAEDPWWRTAVPTFRRTADGFRFEAPVADMSVHLPWLRRRLERLGGTVRIAALGNVDEALRHARVVVDAGGLGARELAGDRTLVPVRGQVVHVAQVGIDEWLLDQSDARRPLYIVPRERDVVLGGTAQEGDEDLRADPALAVAIRERCAAAMPALARAAVVGGGRAAAGAGRGAPRARAASRRPGRALLRPRRRRRDAGVGLRRGGHRARAGGLTGRRHARGPGALRRALAELLAASW